MSDLQRAPLVAHYRVPGHAATARELAEATGAAGYQVVNGQYGWLGSMLREVLDYRAEGQQSHAIATFIPPGVRDNAEWVWVMHAELVQALRSSGWVTDAESLVQPEESLVPPERDGPIHDEAFGTTDEYLRAFEAVRAEGIPDNHLNLLRAHFAAPNHTATWAQLAAFVGYANFKAVNLQYGKLAARVAVQLGISQPPLDFWLSVLAGWAAERDPDSGHTAFVLRRPVVEALRQLGLVSEDSLVLLPDELDPAAPIHEGGRHQVLVNAYERSREARRQCIVAHGSDCCICGFSFGNLYGPEAEGYIHVHHVRALSEIGDDYVVDPVEDLLPVCPNCHAVLHLPPRCRDIDEVRQLLVRYRPAEPGPAAERAGCK